MYICYNNWNKTMLNPYIHNTIFCIISIILFAACSPSPEVSVTCEKDDQGDYILKWETYPDYDDLFVEIYASNNDSVFDSTPLCTIKSDEYMSVIKKGDSLGYKFFQIKAGRTMSDVITNRIYALDSVQNFRDLGGYHTNDNKKIRWNKVFRSGDFSRMTKNDINELSKLNIKTVIDLRPKTSIIKRPDRLHVLRRYELPAANITPTDVSKRILDGQFMRGDAVIYTQDLYRDIIDNYGETYARFFDILCDESNYPLVYHCFLGKDQSGLASYFLLCALDIPKDQVEDDYMISNAGIIKTKLIKGTDNLPESSQEALTMFASTDVAFLKYAIKCMKDKSGSVDEYMLKELKLTPEKREKLRKILLY